jgi:hypothetical protein
MRTFTVSVNTFVFVRDENLPTIQQWQAALSRPIREQRQSDGRIRRWSYIDAEAKYLRVILLSDGETVHNAFFDRDFKP